MVVTGFGLGPEGMKSMGVRTHATYLVAVLVLIKYGTLTGGIVTGNAILAVGGGAAAGLRRDHA